MPELSAREIVGSAVVGEAVSRICSYLIGQREEDGGALLRIQAAIEEADDWHITNRPLVRWRDMLRRAAAEGERVLWAYKHRVAEEEEEEACRRWLPSRVALASKKLFNCGAGEQQSMDVVRRFERLADGVGDFMRLVESGGRAKRFVPFQPLAASLLARKASSPFLRSPATSASSATAHAFAFPDLTSPYQRPRAQVVFLYVDGATGEKLELFVELVVSESADVMAMALACMDALPPHFRFASAAAFGSFHRLQAQGMEPDTDDDHRAVWDAHFCSQPHRDGQVPNWMAAGYGHEPEPVAALPEQVLFVVAEWDSPAVPGGRPPVHVSYDLGRHGADWPVRRAQMTERFLDRSFGTQAGQVDRYADADADVFDGLMLHTVDGFRRRSSSSVRSAGQVVRWCFLSGWVVHLSVRSVGAGPPYVTRL